MKRRILPRLDKQLRRTYETAIIGGGVHGLGLAYNLAKRGMKNVAVFEKSYLGSGASGRNTTLIRSAFSTPEWIDLMQASVDAWQTLSDEIGFNVMFTRRGYLIVATSEKNAELCRRAVPLQNSRGVASRLVDVKEIKAIAPCLDTSRIHAGVFQSNGGIARHDAVVWGYAAAADRLGVDIFPNTEVTAIDVEGGQVRGVRTTRGSISTPRVVNAAGGHSPDVARLAGVELPAKTYPLEAFVTEPIKPMLDPAMICLETLTYLNQTARGEFVAGSEPEQIPPSRSIRSTFDFLELTARHMVQLIPALAGASILRQWAGLIDMTLDLGPLLGETDEVKGFCLDCGWGGYGFMASPGAGRLMADYIVSGGAPAQIKPFAPNRFALNKQIHEPSLVVLLPEEKSAPAAEKRSA
ncbi:MAG TPA: FAD-dependent oxidoreductase [Candidatus Binataceae bacterium]|nr:FAD-dependent oxidoreductase [Candidatus Binataceae bacterium]